MSSEREAVVVREKPWWTSKTMVFNCVVAVMLGVEMNFSTLETILAPESYAYLAMFVNIANLFLRAITKSPVTLK